METTSLKLLQGCKSNTKDIHVVVPRWHHKSPITQCVILKWTRAILKKSLLPNRTSCWGMVSTNKEGDIYIFSNDIYTNIFMKYQFCSVSNLFKPSPVRFKFRFDISTSTIAVLGYLENEKSWVKLPANGQSTVGNNDSALILGISWGLTVSFVGM